jgi:2-polyprenyl-3-methyl-5-hydroxy-6-metoxy-1,4-benzoquinol methylase
MIVFNKEPIAIINNVSRYVEVGTDYTQSFGFQWNKFQKTQIDVNNETYNSKIRFFAETNWDKENLEHKNILEVGSGAGRFSEVILKYTKANLYSLDYSNAVEANYRNNEKYGERFNLIQASIYEMPYEPKQFDKVVCVGVLQHTPNFKDSIAALANMVKPGGELVVDFYPIRSWYTKICAKYIFRPITKKWNHEKLLLKIENNINWMIKASHFLHKIKLGFLTRFVPICDIYNTLPYKALSKDELKEWCILDTFDMFSPEHDHPQRISTVKKWVENTGLNTTFAGFIKYENSEAAVVKAVRN